MPFDGKCEHCWSAWTTAAREINHETDPVYVLRRYCYLCKLVEDA